MNRQKDFNLFIELFLGLIIPIINGILFIRWKPMRKIDYSSISRDKLESLLKIIPEIVKESNITKLLRSILAQATAVMEAERSSIFIYDEQSRELWTLVTEGDRSEEIRIPSDQGIVGYVVKSKQTYRVSDAYESEFFHRDVDMRTGFRTHSVIAMPLFNTTGGILGVIEVMNKKVDDRVFSERDEILLEAFSSLIAISIENTMHILSLEEKISQIFTYSSTLEAYVGPHIAEHIRNHQDPTMTPAILTDRAILFSDIRDYTAMSHKLSPEENVALLNRFFQMIGDTIEIHGGRIEKLIGDSVMASFPDCNEAFLAADSFLKKLNQQKEFTCGIGISFGRLLMGNIGSDHKLDYTMIGEAVNLASRLETMTKEFNHKLVITKDFYQKLAPEHRSRLISLGEKKVRGLENPLEIYAMDLIMERRKSRPGE